MIAAIYARKSTEQAGVSDDQKSIARQIDHARAYAAGKGWTVADEHVYVDDGISGAEFANRPSFLRLMNALKPQPAFNALIMSEESRLGREAIETAYALKQLVTAGVRVFFYLENRERTLDSPTDKIMMSLTAFADELEREKARQRTYDAMLRKARAGHVTGGRVFGYDNIDVLGPGGERSHVDLRINEAEAAIVRDIFARALRGEGLRGIAKALNVGCAVSPRAQQARPTGWAPSTVRAVLHRDLYRGLRVWNKTRKRDVWGQKHATPRASAEWLTVPAEHLRIVTEAVWQAVHTRTAARQERYARWKEGDPGGAPDGRGVRTRYFLAGFARCAVCGGSMQAVSRSSGGGRQFRYTCATYWNRGASVCGNGLTARMATADDAIRELLRREVLQPTRIERALDRTLQLLKAEEASGTNRDAAERRLVAIERELANLGEMAARGGAVETLHAALQQREEERRRLRAGLQELEHRNVGRVSDHTVRGQLRGFLDRWRDLLAGDMPEARSLLDLVLADRVRFEPTTHGKGVRGYTLTVPIAFGRLLMAAIPEYSGSQDMVASPTGPDPVLRCDYVVELPAA